MLLAPLRRRPLTTAMSDAVESAKRIAARRAVDDYVREGMRVGVGSGSTIVYAVERLGERARSAAAANPGSLVVHRRLTGKAPAPVCRPGHPQPTRVFTCSSGRFRVPEHVHICRIGGQRATIRAPRRLTHATLRFKCRA